MFCARSSFSFSTTNHFGIPPSRTVASKSTRPLPTAFIFYKTSNNTFKTSKILTYPILVVNRRFLSRYKILMLFFFFIFLFYAILYFTLLLFTLLCFTLLYFVALFPFCGGFFREKPGFLPRKPQTQAWQRRTLRFWAGSDVFLFFYSITRCAWHGVPSSTIGMTNRAAAYFGMITKPKAYDTAAFKAADFYAAKNMTSAIDK